MRRFSVFLLAASLAIFALPSFGTAQAPRRSPALLAPLQLANRALIEGRYDEIDALTEKLDSRDPNVVAVRARAAIARGRYAQAETALRPVVTRAPASEAALELGLLQQMLGKPDAAAILDKVSLQAETSDDPNELARAARALRALGRFQEANAAYRLAATTAPNDAAIETAWGDLFLEKYNQSRRAEVVPDRAAGRAKWAPALLGSARALVGRESAAGGEPRQTRARNQPLVGRCPGVSRRARPPTRGTTTKRVRRCRRRSR